MTTTESSASRGILVLLVTFLFVFGAGLTGFAQAPSEQPQTRGQPPAASEKLGSSDYFEVYYDTGSEKQDGPEKRYSVLLIELDLGDSKLNKQERRSLWNRFLAQFWKESSLASFVVKVGDQPPLPFYTIVKDANDEQLDQLIGTRRISPPRVFAPADNMSVTLTVDFTNKVDSNILGAAQKAAGTIASVLGAGPAAITISKIPSDAVSAVDRFLGGMNSETRKVAPNVQIKGNQLTNDFNYEFRVYDGPLSESGRKVIAKVKLRFEQFPSLYQVSFPISSAEKNLFNSILHRGLDGKTEKEGGTSVYKLIKDDSIYRYSLGANYSDYLSFCKALPDVLGQFGFSPIDVTVQQYAFLLAAEGGGKRRDPDSEVCPDAATAADMRRLGLPPLPAETYDPSKVIDRGRLRQALGEIASALARASGFAEVSRGGVLLRQSVDLFPGLPLNEDRERGGDEIEEFFSSIGPANSVRLSKFDFTGEGERSGRAILRVFRPNKAAGKNPDRYQLRVVLDPEYLVQRMSIDAAK